MAIDGRSAGGLLIGAVLNMDPSLYAVAVAGVPFVDVINTMMDDTIPLTINEYEGSSLFLIISRVGQPK